MALMLGKLYDALREAGATEDAAREASEELAAFRRLARIEILVAANPPVLGVLVPLIAGILWLVWDTNQAVRLLRVSLDG